MTTDEYRRQMGLPDNEHDVVDVCRKLAKQYGCVLEEVGQRNAKRSGSTVGFPDLVLAVAGWWVPLECKYKKEPSVAQAEMARWRWEHGVDTARITSGQDFADVVGFCMRNPQPALRLPHSLVECVEGRRRR
jgi:hypothetical protein